MIIIKNTPNIPPVISKTISIFYVTRGTPIIGTNMANVKPTVYLVIL